MTASDEQAQRDAPLTPPSFSARLADEHDGAPRDPVQRDFVALRDALERQAPDHAGLVERLLVALLAEGHLLLAGTAGLTETSAMEALAAALRTQLRRVQMTADLLPADLISSQGDPREGAHLHAEPARVPGSLLLVEDLDRAPGRVQALLVEALDKRPGSIGRERTGLPMPTLILASLAPPEQPGTERLSRGQRDHFLMQLPAQDPSHGCERAALRRHRQIAKGEQDPAEPSPAIDEPRLSRARRCVLDLHLAPEVEDYLVRLVQATRAPEVQHPSLAGLLRRGAGSRATLALERCARGHAWLAGRDYVSPDDVHALAPDVLRHRLVLSDTARAAGRTPDDVIAALVGCIAVA